MSPNLFIPGPPVRNSLRLLTCTARAPLCRSKDSTSLGSDGDSLCLVTGLTIVATGWLMSNRQPLPRP